MKKTVEITLETAKQMYNSGVDSLKQLALDNFTKEELEKIKFPIWKEIYKNYLVNNCIEINGNENYTTQLQALSKLLYARDIYNGDWKPNWGNNYTYKHIIGFNKDKVQKSHRNITQAVLAFKDEETRDAFYENFKDLIEEAKELL